VNTEQLRQSLKARWLNYYEENREWLTRLGVWVDCEGERRPSSGFILATLSVLEPNLTHLLQQPRSHCDGARAKLQP